MLKTFDSAVGVNKVPATKKNLASVINIIWWKKTGNLSLMIMSEDEYFDFLDLPEMPVGVDELGPGGMKMIVKLFEVITGQSFRLLVDDEETIRYSREDFHQRFLVWMSPARREKGKDEG